MQKNVLYKLKKDIMIVAMVYITAVLFKEITIAYFSFGMLYQIIVVDKTMLENYYLRKFDEEREENEKFDNKK